MGEGELIDPRELEERKGKIFSRRVALVTANYIVPERKAGFDREV